jgi:hypothetical protein
LEIRFRFRPSTAGGSLRLIEVAPCAELLPVSVFPVRPKVSDSGHGQKGKNMDQILVIKHYNRGFANSSLIPLPHPVFRPIGHPDFERDALVNRGLNLIPCHFF